MQFDYKPARAKISGDALSIIGTVNVNVAGGTLTATAAISGQTLYLINDGIHNVVAIDPSNNTVKAGISGQAIRLVNDGVNNVVFAQIDPANNRVAAKLSGEIVGIINNGINNIVKISGETIKLPNDGINNVVVISGQNIYNYGITPRANALVSCVGVSGGTTLPNLPCVKLYVRSVSGNDVMYVGGTGAQAPFSGTGIELYGGEVMPLEVGNANQISVFAATAAQRVSILAIDK